MRMAASSYVLDLMTTTSRLPYAWLERLTRPLIEENLWTHRKNRVLRIEHLACLICAIPALQPSDALVALKRLQSLALVEFRKTAAPPQIALRNTCTLDDAIFYHAGSDHPTLYEYIASIVTDLVSMSGTARYARIERLRNAGYSISVCLDPPWGTISWYEADGDRRVQHAMRWKPAQPDLSLESSDMHHGVERITRIPVDLLRVAADIYAETQKGSAESHLEELPAGRDYLPDAPPSTHDDAALAGAAPSRVVDDALPPEAQSKRAYPLATLNKDQDGNSAASDGSDAKRVRENAQALSSCSFGRPPQLLGGLYQNGHSFSYFTCAPVIRD